MEFRDPIHQFIRIDDLERRVIDTPPVQRLRHIRQLATTSWVYAGAGHTRFEHALGTMELASRAFDAAVGSSDPSFLAAAGLPRDKWATARRLVRLGGLLHDIGHTPFSHALEKLLPLRDGRHVTHEDLTYQLVLEQLSGQLQLDHLAPVSPLAVAALAVGPEHADLSDAMLKLLSDLITGTLGVDRMDYLLRDSYYTGVTYGRFDLERLIATIKIVPDDEGTPVWALDVGGREIAEQMLMARYFMTLQVYSHKTRRILDIHLQAFVRSLLDEGVFPTDLVAYLQWTDAEIVAALRAATTPDSLALTARQHHRLVREFSSSEFASPQTFTELVTATTAEFPSIQADWVDVSLRKPGDAGLFIADGQRVTELGATSELIQRLTARSIARIYAPQSDRVKVRAYLDSRI